MTISQLLNAIVVFDAFSPMSPRPWAPALALLATLLVPGAAPGAHASVFATGEVESERFVLVSAPIGSTGERAQLNIYEQISDRRPCFAVGTGSPSAVNPLLSTFDFTGICGRYLDANGYSLRIAGSDLGTVYRLSVSRSSNDTVLLALPTRAGAGPEMVVARTKGPGNGYLKLELEPGWKLMRRYYGNRKLGHIYIYNDTWPSSAESALNQAAPSDPTPGQQPAPGIESPAEAQETPTPLLVEPSQVAEPLEPITADPIQPSEDPSQSPSY